MLKVSPLQSVKIFGLWDQPRFIVQWDDVKHLNWSQLRREYGFSPEELRVLQPDKKEWLKRNRGVSLFDLPEMSIFPVNPYDDLNADLAEVWSMRWGVDLWIRMGITYKQMKRAGLTPQIMKLMDLKMNDWVNLKLEPEDVCSEEISGIFGLGVEECQDVIRKFGT